jgi:protein-L-isoaspartate(D-aspartate) O-methyltransferase
MTDEEGYAIDRERMVARQIAGRGISDEAVLRAMLKVPREAFVLPGFEQYAYDDTPLPIPGDQTISQPYVVALMISVLEVRSEDRLLEIGTGSGYAAALMGQIAREVHTVERLPVLVNYARQRLRALGCDNVHVHEGDGTLGWPEHGPYDGIVVAAGGPNIPEALRTQLAIGGNLVIPIGSMERRQNLICVTRYDDDRFEERDLGSVAFVPLIGREGW